MSVTSFLFRAARWSADARSVRRNRAPERIANKAIGRTAARALSRMWK